MAASTSLSPSTLLPPKTPPPKLIPLPLTSFSLLSLSSTTVLSQSLQATEPLVPILPKQYSHSSLPSDLQSVLYPSLTYSNILFFKSAYNVQVAMGDDEPEDQLIGRFRREVLRAGILQETKRRRFFETTQDKRKRKSREAAKRNSKRRQRPKSLKDEDKQEAPKKKDKDEDDNWEFIDTELPYCDPK